MLQQAVADPGFPIGEALTHLGDVDLQCRCFLVKMCAKAKELGSIVGACVRHAPMTGIKILAVKWLTFGAGWPMIKIKADLLFAGTYLFKLH